MHYIIINIGLEIMKSIFTDTINLENPFPFHPNPYFRRESFLSLDGYWDFDITKTREPLSNYTKRIVVPFSPETPLSQIETHIEKDDWMHYRKRFNLSKVQLEGIGRLVFTAVDQECFVYLNGEYLGEHRSGYSTFEFEVTNLREENELVVIVRDDTNSEIYPRGKQSNTPGGIWYHPTSGIWGDVYLEFVPSSGKIEKLDISTDYKNRKISINGVFTDKSPLIVEIFKDNLKLISTQIGIGESVDCSSFFEVWSPDNPALFDIRISQGKDSVWSVFGFKLFERKQIGKNHYLFLNEKPIFLSSLLDQGYWPDGGLTAPCYEAISHDIDTIKNAGFNSLRKHIKIESMRWYYECDKKGIIVIQDIMNSGSKYSWWLIHLRPFINFDVNDNDNKILGRGSKESMEQFEKDMFVTLEQLSQPTCICVWTLFNEGWGQFRAPEMFEKMKTASGNKLIDATSGWYDKGVGDFNSRHIYFRAPKMKSDSQRVLFLSEFGGYSMPIEHHTYSKKSFGYASYKDNSALNKALKKVYGVDLIKAIKEAGLSACVYTQISDVEEEINGLMTYDRAVFKPDVEMLRSLNSDLYKVYCETIEKI